MRDFGRFELPVSDGPWRTAVIVFLCALLFSGCRTYGRYDAQEKMLPKMQESVRLFASDLEQAQSNLNLLQQAARGDSALGVVADEYKQAVQRHAEILNENQKILDRFEADLPDYRKMHRTLGAMLSEHRAARNRYRSLTKAVRYPGITVRMDPSVSGPRSRAGRSLPDTLLRARDESFTESRYYVAPIFYERLQSAGSDITMRQALSERKQRQSQQGGLVTGEQGSNLPSSADEPMNDTEQGAQQQ